jgi:hypothetical protein
MNNLNLVIPIALALMGGGIVLASVMLGARRTPNPKRHPAADGEYTRVYVHGLPHAFTDEALNVARARAIRLKIE